MDYGQVVVAVHANNRPRPRAVALTDLNGRAAGGPLIRDDVKVRDQVGARRVSVRDPCRSQGVARLDGYNRGLDRLGDGGPVDLRRIKALLQLVDALLLRCQPGPQRNLGPPLIGDGGSGDGRDDRRRNESGRYYLRATRA